MTGADGDAVTFKVDGEVMVGFSEQGLVAGIARADAAARPGPEACTLDGKNRRS
jgi:hypothetical protein